MSERVKCNVCGAAFTLRSEDSYIARDAYKGDGEPKQYDAFDCPFCGCQYVAQERKRLIEISEIADLETGYEKISDETGCEKCRYLESDENEEPCASCSHNFIDHFAWKGE